MIINFTITAFSLFDYFTQLYVLMKVLFKTLENMVQQRTLRKILLQDIDRFLM